MASVNFRNALNEPKVAPDLKYGAAPSPNIPLGHIDISALGTRMPGVYCFTTTLTKDTPAIAIKRYYYKRDPVDQSYEMAMDGKAYIKPYSGKVRFVSLLFLASSTLLCKSATVSARLVRDKF